MVDFGRLVEIKASSEGSGFLIADGLILTTWHLLRQEGGQARPSTVRVRLERDAKHNKDLQTAAVLWPLDGEPGDNLDFALLGLPRSPANEPSTTPIHWASLPRWGEIDVTAVGYPDVAIDPSRNVRDTKGLAGWVQLADNQRALANGQGTLAIHLLNEDLPAEPAAIAWTAMSGAAVFVGSVLVGMIRTAGQENGSHRLHMLPIDRLLTREEVANIIGEAGYEAPVQVELPARRKVIEENILAFRRAITRRAMRPDWWNAPIPLHAVTDQARKGNARDMLKEWLDGGDNPHCIILGDPGSGKSGLVWWIASILAEDENTIPLLIRASKMRGRSNISLAFLGQIAEPSPGLNINFQIDDVGERQLFLLLDGLDELVGFEVGGHRFAKELVARVLGSVPESARIVVATRPPAFEVIGSTLERELPNGTLDPDPGDSYEVAFAQRFGATGQNCLILHLQPVPPTEARKYLERRRVAEQLVVDATSSQALTPFLSTPFSLRLMTKALPRLAKVAAPVALHDLYREYVSFALGIADHDLLPETVAAIAARERIISEIRRAARYPQRLMDKEADHIARRAGLISRTDNEYEFYHYTLWEYFFALGLFADLIAYDSRFLSRLDLVAGYNINRMLVPMVVREMQARAPERAFAPRMVLSGEYLAFTEDKGWRKSTGYGVHPSMTRSSDGTPSATFSYNWDEVIALHRKPSTDNSSCLNVFDRKLHLNPPPNERDLAHDQGLHQRTAGGVASAISWYDAAVFAMYTGRCLPTSTAAVDKLCGRGDFLFWCMDWDNETFAHIRVLESKTGRILGLNPDVRLPRTALAVMDMVAVNRGL